MSPWLNLATSYLSSLLQGERRGLLVSGGSSGSQIQASTLFFDINKGQWAKLGDMNTRRLLRKMLYFLDQG